MCVFQNGDCSNFWVVSFVTKVKSCPGPLTTMIWDLSPWDIHKGSHGQRSPKMEELIIRLLIGMLICMKKLPLIRLMTIYCGETIAVDWPWHKGACLKIPVPKKSDPPKYNHFFQVAVLVFLSFILTWGRFSIAHEVVICCFQMIEITNLISMNTAIVVSIGFRGAWHFQKIQLQSSNLR